MHANNEELTADLEGFLEGIEHKVTEDDGLGIFWGEQAALDQGAPEPPPDMTEPVWNGGIGWTDSATAPSRGLGLVIRAPHSRRESLQDAELDRLEAPDSLHNCQSV